MNKIYKILSLLVFSVFILASCMKTDETAVTPECAILSFSISDFKTKITVHRENLSDTTVTRTISGSSINFNIDQLNGIITTVDSVANWADLSNIKPSFTANGYVTYRNEQTGNYYYLTSGADSLSFEKPVEFMAVATDGVSYKKYTVSIKKNSLDTDTIIWNKNNNNLIVNDKFKTFVKDNTVFAFVNDNNGSVNYSYSSINDKLAAWTTPASVNGAELNYESVVLFNDEFYALSNDGYIYKAQDSNNPSDWNKVSDRKFSQLLSSDKYYIYAFDGNEIVGSADLQNWISSGNTDIDMLPSSSVESYSFVSKTNSDIQVATMCGISNANNKYSTAWYKISSEDKDINQNWMYINISDDNKYGLPRFSDMSYTRYNNSLYAIGINAETGKYEYLYISDDNGITWKAQRTKYPLPEDLDANNGSAKLICADDKLWIIQKGGKIWSGTIK